MNVHGSAHPYVRIGTKRTPSSAPSTPKVEQDELGEYRMPFSMSQLPPKKARAAREAEALRIATESKEGMVASPSTIMAGNVPSSPVTPKQSPLPFMPPSPASSTGVAMSPTRKESYKDLITRAISSHPDKLMTLSDIYAWIVANVEAYRDQSHIPSTQGWKNAIRHTLSFYKCFKRVKRHPSIEKPSYWTIDYSETTAGTSGLVPASPKSAPMSNTSSAPGITTSSIHRPVPTTPTSLRQIAREEIAIEETPRESATNPSDLRSWASSWPMRSEATASKEEQCIQGLLLFRTSAGFSFLPQSGSEPQRPSQSTSNISVMPKFPSPPRVLGERSSDILTYTSCAQVFSRHESVESSSGSNYHRFENGTPKTYGHGQATTGGTSVTVVVDTLAGSSRPPLTTTWTTASGRDPVESSVLQMQAHNRRKPQLQKRYLEPTIGIAQSPKPEAVSYVQLIANAILATPEKRATLSQIYDWLVANVAAFEGQGGSPSSVGWKNAVRHTLSTRPFFKRVICEEAFGRQKPAWWTVDVEAMNLASSLRQQQQLKLPRRRRNGAHEAFSVPASTEETSPTQRSPYESVIRRAGDKNQVILEKSASEPPEPIRAATSDEIKWPIESMIGEKEALSSPEPTESRTTIFRYPSSSFSSVATSTTSNVSAMKSELLSPLTVESGQKSIMISGEDMIRNAVFENAVGIGTDVFECLLTDLGYSFDSMSSSWKILQPRDALILTLLRLRRQQAVFNEYDQHPRTRRQLKRVYVRWLPLLSSHLTSLIIWPSSDSTRLPPPYLTDRLISFERMKSPEHVAGVLDIFTMEVLFDHTDECCRRTINAVIVYNFDGAVIYRSKKFYWLGCAHHVASFQSGLCTMIEDCLERDLKQKITEGGQLLVMYKSIADVLPWPIHVVRSRLVRNVLKEKFGDRLSRFDVLNKPVMLTRPQSSPVTMLSTLDDVLTVCCGLLNLSTPIVWADDGF